MDNLIKFINKFIIFFILNIIRTSLNNYYEVKLIVHVIYAILLIDINSKFKDILYNNENYSYNQI